MVAETVSSNVEIDRPDPLHFRISDIRQLDTEHPVSQQNGLQLPSAFSAAGPGRHSTTPKGCRTASRLTHAANRDLARVDGRNQRNTALPLAASISAVASTGSRKPWANAFAAALVTAST